MSHHLFLTLNLWRLYHKIHFLSLARLLRVQQRVFTYLYHFLANIDLFQSLGLIKVGLNMFRFIIVYALCKIVIIRVNRTLSPYLFFVLILKLRSVRHLHESLIFDSTFDNPLKIVRKKTVY